MNIFIGCSSQNAHNLRYKNEAEKLGNFINTNKHTLVFGGCNSGLMGVIYNSIANKTDYIVAVLSKAYENDLNSLSYKKSYVFDTIIERKQCFYDHSDALVFLPGGIGTLDEIISAIESKRNHEHSLPILIVNTNGFFNPLLNMINKIYAEGFTNPKFSKLYHVVNSCDDVIKLLSKN